MDVEKTSSIELVNDKTQDILAVFPNPTKEGINVRIAQNVMSLELYATDGRLVKDLKMGSNHLISMSLVDNVSGVYILKAIDANGEIVAIERVIKI